MDEEEGTFIGSTAEGRTVRFDVGRDYGNVIGYEVRVSVISGTEEQEYLGEWYLDEDQTEGLGRTLLGQASIVRGLNEQRRIRFEKFHRQHEEGWAEELPKLRDDGFEIETPELGPVRLAGHLPTGERFVFTCAETTCRLSFQFPDGKSQEWEDDVVGLEGDRHARWMLPKDAARVLKSMVKKRPHPLT